ncbi:MAG: hypothetical protein EBW14_17095, partial [Oxalobacteraceae bacterium]|nr:hypothetical protein [Oxalobacteraceae bacterium]
MGQHLKLNLSMLFRAMATRERELRLGQSAASLSFISLLAMVPLLTVVFATLASFPLFGRVAEAVQLLVMEQLLPEGFAILKESPVEDFDLYTISKNGRSYLRMYLG